MPATIKDIAKLVGVNPSTVSRVINGTAKISEETRQKILDAMKELDYHPNLLARNLVSGSTKTIGLVIDAGNEDAFANAFFIRSVSAIEFEAQKRGYNVLIVNSKSSSEQDEDNPISSLVLNHKIDGIILPVSSIQDELVELLISNSFPFVILGDPGKDDERISWVDMDNEQGCRIALDHLFETGYKNPVMFVENKGTVFERKRISGFEKGLEAHGIRFDRTKIVEAGNETEEITDTVKNVFSSKANSNIDSIICTNNIVAYNVLRELRKHGRTVPYDVGVITFDNFPLAEYMEPALTVVDVDTYKMGQEAATVLFETIKDRERDCSKTLIPTQMILRKSTNK